MRFAATPRQAKAATMSKTKRNARSRIFDLQQETPAPPWRWWDGEDELVSCCHGDIREKMKEEELVIQTNLYGSFELGPAGGPVFRGWSRSRGEDDDGGFSSSRSVLAEASPPVT